MEVFNFPCWPTYYKKKRQLFNDYGPCSAFNSLNGKDLLKQKQHGVNYKACQPVLPTSTECKTLQLNEKDIVMGAIIDTNRQYIAFKKKFTKLHTLVKGCKERTLTEFGHLQETIDIMRECNQTDMTRLTDMMSKRFTEMWHLYQPIENSVIKRNNEKFTGGCISTVEDKTGDTYLVTAYGPALKSLSLSRLKERHNDIYATFPLTETKLDNTIYRIASRKVHGKDYVLVKTEPACLLFDIKGKTSNTRLHEMNCIKTPDVPDAYFQSISLSPYIPGESILSLNDGSCWLWNSDNFDQCAPPCAPRFERNCTWNQVHYGCHPRQIGCCDQTVLRMLDLRVRDSEATDIFSIPNTCLHNLERLRAYERPQTSSFYHLLATDYNLILTDERFPNHPVLRWDHMLSSPPQYISCVPPYTTIHRDTGQAGQFVYVGSQYPAEVNGFRYTELENGTPVLMGKPYRAAHIKDIATWPSFVEECNQPKMLDERLNVSLAGIATQPVEHGHIVFQMDCYGEVYHQTFGNNVTRDDVTFSAPRDSNSVDLQPGQAAVVSAKDWISNWEKMMSLNVIKNTKRNDIRPGMHGLMYKRTPSEYCCLCKPCAVVQPSTSRSQADVLCSSCLVLPKDAKELIKTAQLDGIMAPLGTEENIRHLHDVDSLSKKTALTKLLLKHWQKDTDIDDVLLEWDDEVIEKRKKKEQRSSLDSNPAEETHPLSRLLSLLPSSSNHANTVASLSEIVPVNRSADYTSTISSGSKSNSTGRHIGTQSFTSENGIGTHRTKERDSQSRTSKKDKRANVDTQSRTSKKSIGANMDARSTTSTNTRVNEDVQSIVSSKRSKIKKHGSKTASEFEFTATPINIFTENKTLVDGGSGIGSGISMTDIDSTAGRGTSLQGSVEKSSKKHKRKHSDDEGSVLSTNSRKSSKKHKRKHSDDEGSVVSTNSRKSSKKHKRKHSDDEMSAASISSRKSSKKHKRKRTDDEISMVSTSSIGDGTADMSFQIHTFLKDHPGTQESQKIFATPRSVKSRKSSKHSRKDVDSDKANESDASRSLFSTNLNSEDIFLTPKRKKTSKQRSKSLNVSATHSDSDTFMSPKSSGKQSKARQSDEENVFKTPNTSLKLPTSSGKHSKPRRSGEMDLASLQSGLTSPRSSKASKRRTMSGSESLTITGEEFSTVSFEGVFGTQLSQPITSTQLSQTLQSAQLSQTLQSAQQSQPLELSQNSPLKQHKKKRAPRRTLNDMFS